MSNKIAIKTYRQTLDISANNRITIDTNTTFFTRDIGTARKILTITDDGNPLDLTDSLVVIGFDYRSNFKRKIIDSDDESIIFTNAEKGELELFLPNHLFNYSGEVLVHVFVKYPDGRESDAGIIQTRFQESWLDKELPEMDDFYVKRFEDLAEEIRRKVEEIKTEMNKELDTVKKDLTTAQTDINSIQKQINDNDVVTRNEAKETLAEYDRKLFESASLLHQIDHDTTIENTREGKLTSRSLTGRTLVNLWSDNRGDFQNIASNAILSGNAVSITAGTGNTPFRLANTRFKPNTAYTVMLDVSRFDEGLSLEVSINVSDNLFSSSPFHVRGTGRHMRVLTTHADLTGKVLRTTLLNQSGVAGLQATMQISIYEGDLTKLALKHTQPLTLASVGDGVDKLEVKTVGVNLFDGALEQGTFNASGQPISQPTVIRSVNFIPVQGGKVIRLQNFGGTSTTWGIMEYDAHGNTLRAPTEGFVNTPNITLLANTRYIKFRSGSSAQGDLNRDINVTYDDLLNAYAPHQSTTSIYEYQNDDGRWLPVPNLKGIMDGANLLVGDEITDNEYIQRVLVMSGVDHSVGDQSVVGGFLRFSLRGVNNSHPNEQHSWIMSNKIPNRSFNWTQPQQSGMYLMSGVGSVGNLAISIPNPFASTPSAAQIRQHLIDNDYQFLVPLATPKHYPIRTQSLSSFNPTTNVVMQTGAVQPRFNFKIVQSLSERMTVAEGSIRKQGDKISDVNADLDNLVNKIDALKPTTAPLPLASTPQIGTSGRYADASHVHQMPTASQVGALPLAGGTMTGALSLASGVGIHSNNTANMIIRSLPGNKSNNTTAAVRIGRMTFNTTWTTTSASIRMLGDENFIDARYTILYRTNGALGRSSWQCRCTSASQSNAVTSLFLHEVEITATQRVVDIWFKYPATYMSSTQVIWESVRNLGNLNTAVQALSTDLPTTNILTSSWVQVSPNTHTHELQATLTGAVEGTATSDLANGVAINTQNRLVSVADWDSINPTTLGLRNGDTVNIIGSASALNQPLNTTNVTWVATLRRVSTARFLLSAETSLERLVIREWRDGTWRGWNITPVTGTSTVFDMTVSRATSLVNTAGQEVNVSDELTTCQKELKECKEEITQLKTMMREIQQVVTHGK